MSLNRHRAGLLAGLACAPLASISKVEGQSPVAFPTDDGGVIQADLYGAGRRGVVLAHGGRFNKESWAPQAGALAAAGFQVVAIDFRGYGKSTGPGQDDPMGAPLHLDVLAAVRYLRAHGATTVAAVGGSMGGNAAAEASVSAPGQIDRIVLLAGDAGSRPEHLVGPKLFIMARGDTTASGKPRLTRMRAQYELAPDPKRLLLLEGSAHAQDLFQTDEGAGLMREILAFLEEPSRAHRH